MEGHNAMTNMIRRSRITYCSRNMAACLKGKRNLKNQALQPLDTPKTVHLDIRSLQAPKRAVTPSRTCKRETYFSIPEMRTTCKTKKKYFASPAVQVQHSSKGPVDENLKNQT